MANNRIQGKDKQKRYSPKLTELCKWDRVAEVNKKLDSGESPASVCTWVNKVGFKISPPLMYDYAKMRKKALVDGINVEHMLGTVSKPVVDRADPLTQSTTKKLKSEIDALDLIIDSGYSTLINWEDRPISPKTMMEAIKLKNDLTDGNHGFLTNYGMEQLRDIEQKKYELIIQHLISYIPKTRQQEAVDKIAEIEDSYYQETDYYEEYVAALEISDTDKKRKLEEYFKSREQGE